MRYKGKVFTFKFILMIGVFVQVICCVNNDLKEKARLKSDAVINGLGYDEAYKYFPEKYFPKEKMVSILNDMKAQCDYENRKGRFIDYFYESIPGPDKISFIYEYYLKCDSIRFILGYKLETDPELIWFKIEPIETENKMIIDKSKQLPR